MSFIEVLSPRCLKVTLSTWVRGMRLVLQNLVTYTQFLGDTNSHDDKFKRKFKRSAVDKEKINLSCFHFFPKSLAFIIHENFLCEFQIHFSNP